MLYLHHLELQSTVRSLPSFANIVLLLSLFVSTVVVYQLFFGMFRNGHLFLQVQECIHTAARPEAAQPATQQAEVSLSLSDTLHAAAAMPG